MISYIKSMMVFMLVAQLPLYLVAQQQEGYRITGKMKGLKEGEKVWLFLNDLSGEKAMDSALVKNGVFELKGHIPQGPRYGTLYFDKHEQGEDTKLVRLFLDNKENITISSDNIDKIRHNIIDQYITIDGSPSNNAFVAIMPSFLFYTQSIKGINSIMAKTTDSIGFNPQGVEAFMAAKKRLHDMFYAFVLKSDEPKYEAAELLAASFASEWHAQVLAERSAQMTFREETSFYGQRLKERAPLSVGQPFPPFTLPGMEKAKVSFDSITRSCKLTLVHFWASNSFMVDKFQDELQVMYKKYRDKGLKIIAVSSDTSEKKWKLAAADLPWIHVSDLKGKNGDVGQTYFEYGNPRTPNTTNVLVNQQGKIIAWDVYGPELQYYLWKYLDNQQTIQR